MSSAAVQYFVVYDELEAPAELQEASSVSVPVSLTTEGLVVYSFGRLSGSVVVTAELGNSRLDLGTLSAETRSLCCPRSDTWPTGHLDIRVNAVSPRVQGTDDDLSGLTQLEKSQGSQACKADAGSPTTPRGRNPQRKAKELDKQIATPKISSRTVRPNTSKKTGGKIAVHEAVKGQVDDAVSPPTRSSRRSRSALPGTKKVVAPTEDDLQMAAMSKKRKRRARDTDGEPRAKRLPATTAECAPPPRWGQSSTLLTRGADRRPHSLIMWGGQGDNDVLHDDTVWRYDVRMEEWRAVPVESGPSPGRRMGHTTVAHEDCLFVFGGSKYEQWLKDVWKLSPADHGMMKWDKMETWGEQPKCSYHSAVVVNSEMIVFGGVNDQRCLGDLHAFDVDEGNFYTPETSGDPPCPRSGHSCVLVDRGVSPSLFFFGGWDSPVCFNDSYELDLAMMEWKKLETKGTPPSPRTWQTCVALRGSNMEDWGVLVYGGFDGDTAMDDAHVLDFASLTWKPVDLGVPSGTPTCRAGHSLTALGDGRAMLFGGGNNEGVFFNDLVVANLPTE